MNYNQLVVAIQDYTENSFNYADEPTPVITFIKQAEQRIYNSVQFPSLRKNSTGVTTASNKYLSCPSDFLSVYSMAIYPDNGEYTFLLNKDVNFIREAYPSPTDTGAPVYYALFGPQSTNEAELTFILGPTPDAIYNVELHYFYYPESIVQRPVTTATIATGGSGYTGGTYFAVPMVGGTGYGAQATVVVSGAGTVTSIEITQGGYGYIVNDSLTLPSTIFPVGTNFAATVTTVGNASGQTWLGDNFDTVLLYGSLVEAYTYMKGEQDMVVLYDSKYKDALALAKRLGDGLERQDSYRSGQYRQSVT